MELIKVYLTKLIKDSASDDKIFIRNLLKNYLQVLVLDFVYSDRKYSQLVFTEVQVWHTAIKCRAFQKIRILLI